MAMKFIERALQRERSKGGLNHSKENNLDYSKSNSENP